jgi:hypothetical protein
MCLAGTGGDEFIKKMSKNQMHNFYGMYKRRKRINFVDKYRGAHYSICSVIVALHKIVGITIENGKIE